MTNNKCNVIGKKNNQTLSFDADRDIPTLGQTDNAGNSVNLVSGIFRFPSGWNFSVCIGDRSDRFCLSVIERCITPVTFLLAFLLFSLFLYLGCIVI